MVDYVRVGLFSVFFGFFMVPSSHVFLLFGMFFRVGCSPKKAKLLLPHLRSWQTAFLVYLFWHFDLLPHCIFGKPSVFLFTLGRVGYGGLHTPPLPPKVIVSLSRMLVSSTFNTAHVKNCMESTLKTKLLKL